METHSSILAWEIPWTKRSFSRMEETRGLQNPQRFSNGYSEVHIIAENKPMLLLLLCSNAYQNLSRGRGVMKTKGNKRGGGIWLVQQCYLTYLCDQIRLNFLIIRFLISKRYFLFYYRHFLHCLATCTCFPNSILLLFFRVSTIV